MTENEIIDLTEISPEVKDISNKQFNDTSETLAKILNEHNGNIFDIDWAGITEHYQNEEIENADNKN